MPKKKKSSTSGGSSWLGWLWKTFVLAAIWGSVALGIVLAWYAYDLPDIHQIAQWQRRPSITMLAEDGTVFARYGDLYGDHVTLATVPACMPEAILAIEDRRFYSHFGVDPIGLLRAAFRNATAGHVVQGGSTITQQLAKNLFLSPERTLRRKIQEMILAFWLENTYSKDEILTAYMNRVYLGAGTYGVDAASRTYFDKPARDMNLRECAILAGLLRAPSRYAPSRDPAQALERARTVLDAMVDAGYITEKQEKAALGNARPERKPGGGGDGRYFSDWVADQMGAMLEDSPQDLIVQTTLDMRLQRSAERHIDNVLAKQDDRDVAQAALVTLAPDGAVKALVGGRDYHESQFNRAVQALRQPGSAFKPIVYLAALQQGLRPDDIMIDEPLRIGKYAPDNFDGQYRGAITVREALAQSINTVAVRVLQRAGIPGVVNTAQALGISSPMERDAALALGSSVVTPLELTTAYAAVAAGGKAIVPYGIKEIRSRNGDVLFRRNDAEAPGVVDPDAVAMLVDMMQEVVRSGTGRRATIGRPVAGKTGTSSDYRDAWFLGFTADYTTGIWVGNDDNHPMKKITGGSLPAQMWHDYMMEAEAGLPERGLFAGNRSWGSTTAAATEDLSNAFSNFLHSVLGSPEPPRDYPQPGRR
ncbi:MAG: transglycosylase domain-containing protein [Bdellovibrionales bacterium]